MTKEILKTNKGITLIALVVSIIVLLILSGISINVLAGQNGILNRVIESKEKTEASQTEEAIKVIIMEAATQGLKKALNNAGISNDHISGDEIQGWKVEIGDNKYQIYNDGTIKEALPAVKDETIPYYPDSTFSYKEGYKR